MIAWETHLFQYRPDGRVNTRDFDTLYAGVFGEDAPEVMHHRGEIFSPVSAFGYTVGAIQAMHGYVYQLETRIATLESLVRSQ